MAVVFPPPPRLRRSVCSPHSHAVDALVDVDGVLPGHHLVNGGAPLLLFASFLERRHLIYSENKARKTTVSNVDFNTYAQTHTANPPHSA